MREREMLKVTKCLRVNSFVGALISKVISEKQCYAAMKYIVVNFTRTILIKNKIYCSKINYYAFHRPRNHAFR